MSHILASKEAGIIAGGNKNRIYLWNQNRFSLMRAKTERIDNLSRKHEKSEKKRNAVL